MQGTSGPADPGLAGRRSGAGPPPIQMDPAPAPPITPRQKNRATGRTGGRLPLPRATRPSRLGSCAAAVVGCIAVLVTLGFVIGELRPDLIFGPGVDVGGDNGGHIAAPYFLIHYLLPRARLTGWDPWWFDGFPLYVFYFPLPAVLIAITAGIVPYAVAFKIVTALGAITLPLAGYGFGKLAAFRRPVPVLMGASMLPFLFNTSYTIDGGNIASTMAGEFSFSLAVSTGLLFLGSVTYCLRTGKLRWLAALLFAITCLCHVIPALVFGATAGLMAVTTTRKRSLSQGLRLIVPIGLVGALLAAWWLLPFAVNLQYSSSMNYAPVGGPWPHWFSSNFLPQGYLFVLFPSALGALIAIFARSRLPLVLAMSAVASVLAFHWLPSGLVYNARWLPFWFLNTALLAAYGVGETFRFVGRFVTPSAMAAAAMAFGTTGAIVGSVFAGGLEGAGFLGYSAPANHTQVSGWIAWNYSGVQARPGWRVFQDIVKLLEGAGRKYGCGRLQYEYLSETTNSFGSTEEMMSIPMWTNGCMQTTDGIYFESSTTTPFHFLDVSEVSQNGEAPDPVAGLNYPGFNLPDGIRHLQLMGVRYFLAMSPPVEAIANLDPALVRLGSAPSFPGPYNKLPVKHPHVVLYLIKHSRLVVPLSHLPEVEKTDQQQWLDTNLRWYENEQYWPTLLARSGPTTWPRAHPGDLVPPSRSVPTGKTTISDIHTSAESVSFDVSRTRVPVLVKIPYFPNWVTTGAEGPYEVSPNLMAVLPTSPHVTLTYGTSTADWEGKLASLVGVVGLGAMITAGQPALPAVPLAPLPSPYPLPDVPALPSEEVTRKDRDQLPEQSAESDDLDLSIVLPAHNEQALLDDTVDHLVQALASTDKSYEIVIVENGSSDQTAARARFLIDKYPGVRLIRLLEADYGEALRIGFLAARGATVVNFDVDYYDFRFLAEATSLITEHKAQVVLASKRAPGSADHRPWPRKLLTATFSVIMRSLLSLPVSDAHGMKAFDRQALAPAVRASQMGGSVFDIEIVLVAHRSGLEIIELATEVHEVRPPRTGVARRSLESLLGLVKLRYLVGPHNEA
ncbi:MAG: glycosyltransferase [Acidimicrobiales bacterium]